MDSTTIEQIGQNETTEVVGTPYVSLEEFLATYAEKEDGYKYEWNDGVVEKWGKMNQEQLIIQDILLRLFMQTQLFKAGGILTAETDMMTTEKQLRRPDLAIYTKKQMLEAAKGNGNQIAIWVAEVISQTDNINKVEEKSDEYFATGVQVVWRIFPSLKKVVVYTHEGQITECRGADICSSQPALDDFEVRAEAIFEYYD